MFECDMCQDPFGEHPCGGKIFFLWCLITARKEVVFRTGYVTKRMTVSCDAWTQVYSVRYLWRRKMF